MQQSLESGEYRRVLSHYPTGVCVVTAVLGVEPIGMVVGSFTSVSLDPPLVAFLPDRRSTTWPKIEAAGDFCVNVLSERQQAMCRTFASKSKNKFDEVSYRLSPRGVPIISDVVAWIDCQLHAVHEAGDHFIVVGRVLGLNVELPDPPLVFSQGAYGTFSRSICDMNKEPVPVTRRNVG
ncbi:flavin reductase family protein [Sphingomonas sp. UYP23]